MTMQDLINNMHSKNRILIRKEYKLVGKAHAVFQMINLLALMDAGQFVELGKGYPIVSYLN